LERIGEQLGIDPETLRNWVVQAEIDEGHRPGTTTDDATGRPSCGVRCGSCAGRTRS
jgi:transposase-like protein